MTEREEEEARGARKTATAPNLPKAKDASTPPSFSASANTSGSLASALTSSHTFVSSSGKRLKIGSLTPPEPVHPPPSFTDQGTHRIPQFFSTAGASPATHQPTAVTPMIPLDAPGQLDRTTPTSPVAASTSILSTTVQRQTKPEQLETRMVTSKRIPIPMVPRDENGRPVLPLNVGIETLVCLGEVCMREHFHTESYIFPVGYSITR